MLSYVQLVLSAVSSVCTSPAGDPVGRITPKDMQFLGRFKCDTRFALELGSCSTSPVLTTSPPHGSFSAAVSHFVCEE
ncbi:MAG: hypothetical protein HOY79_26215 [Streptomyces sp.]|nr:hypothetical protein [Streptomyces sp.]